ncbi:hypothetical protein ZIOFF_072251 [Zingiber officinale]|uniref:Uncharacterized protein n=1 Tax=Zingiber officinale TaxID=94328 RepID=A0A8J5EPA7_ZINOF|nr:hypothetical protein ZIOFF_072251 [Zingiber officinale]
MSEGRKKYPGRETKVVAGRAVGTKPDLALPIRDGQADPRTCEELTDIIFGSRAIVTVDGASSMWDIVSEAPAAPPEPPRIINLLDCSFGVDCFDLGILLNNSSSSSSSSQPSLSDSGRSSSGGRFALNSLFWIGSFLGISIVMALVR